MTARKRLAVPFRAAHTPAERSEFAQPDIALVLTHLAYYYDGLSRQEFAAGVKVLLGMGGNAQHAHYTAWLKLSHDSPHTAGSRNAGMEMPALDHIRCT